MKTTLRLLMASASVAFITLAASGAPLPFISVLMQPKAESIVTLEAPLAPEAGKPADRPMSIAFNLN